LRGNPGRKPDAYFLHDKRSDVPRSVYYILMNAREVIKLLKAGGWAAARSKGSHLTLKHPEKANLITVPMHGSKDIKPGLLIAIERQSGVKLRRR
jgi:predicted RNA binding protein YcfA (HicA-like mRNA interferase family)